MLYYTQRTNAGLIITEAINISEQALGSPLTPGLYTQEQIEAWRKVTRSVHDKGGVIYAQLWHTGRVGHSIDRNGELPVAPSSGRDNLGFRLYFPESDGMMPELAYAARPHLDGFVHVGTRQTGL